MGEIASIFTAIGQVAEIAVNIGMMLAADDAKEGAKSRAGNQGAAARAFDPGTPFTTGDITWSTDQGGYYVYAYNGGSSDVAFTFVNTEPYSGTTLPTAQMTLQSGYSAEVSKLTRQFRDGSVTMTSVSDTGAEMVRRLSGDTGVDRVGGEVMKAVALSISALSLGVSAQLLSGVTFTVTKTSDTAQISFQVARPLTGSFTASINNGPFSATVNGKIDRSSGNAALYDDDLTFLLPSFLGIGVEDDVVDEIEVVMLVPASQLQTATAAKTRVIKGRPTGAARQA